MFLATFLLDSVTYRADTIESLFYNQHINNMGFFLSTLIEEGSPQALLETTNVKSVWSFSFFLNNSGDFSQPENSQNLQKFKQKNFKCKFCLSCHNTQIHVIKTLVETASIFFSFFKCCKRQFHLHF